MSQQGRLGTRSPWPPAAECPAPPLVLPTPGPPKGPRREMQTAPPWEPPLGLGQGGFGQALQGPDGARWWGLPHLTGDSWSRPESPGEGESGGRGSLHLHEGRQGESHTKMALGGSGPGGREGSLGHTQPCRGSPHNQRDPHHELLVPGFHVLHGRLPRAGVGLEVGWEGRVTGPGSLPACPPA